MRITAIVPTLDEAPRLAATVAGIRAAGIADVVVVDGGSRDATLDVARGLGVTLAQSARGRATQQNLGARLATGDALVFVHADVGLPPDAAAWITRTLRAGDVCAGAFRVRHVYDGPMPPPRRARLLPLADVRSHRPRLPAYGDQAIFVTRDAFDAVGGFPERPILEDAELSRRLQRHGGMARLPVAVTVSARRYMALPLTATALSHVLPVLDAMGVPPTLLARTWAVVR